MAIIDLISENTSTTLPTSPRISFSFNLCPKDTSFNSTIEDHPYHYSTDSSSICPNPDFNFSILANDSDTKTSSADELFSGGLIRPIPLQERPVSSKQALMSKPRPKTSSLPPLPKNQSKLSIRRSSSFHCEMKSPVWSFPLLSRSLSTGSLGKGKKHSVETKPQRNSSSSSATAPALPRRTSNADGVRIKAVINILPPHVCKGAADLFRFRSMFRIGKEKCKK